MRDKLRNNQNSCREVLALTLSRTCHAVNAQTGFGTTCPLDVEVHQDGSLVVLSGSST